MSDAGEEQSEHEEQEEEQQEEEQEQQIEEKPKARPKPVEKPGATKELTETEQAIAAARKRHEEEEEQKLAELEEKRRIERERDEEELRLLKEKQERRKAEREQEERELAERKAADEERRRQEEEARKQKAEDDKRRKEEEKRKKAAIMGGGMMAVDAGAGGRNYTVPDKADKSAEKFDKFGNIVKAKAEMGLTKEQIDELKHKHLSEIMKPLTFEGMDINGIRNKVKELHMRICKLEAAKYDMEKRSERQEYDLKELNERQRQIARNKALKKGVDPELAANSKHPPKVAVASKYDRQIDRRTYGDRRTIFECPPRTRKPKVFHGSARPPPEWGARKENEELENLKRILEPPKYQETVKVEGAKPPMDIVPVSIPDQEYEDDDEAPAEEEE